MASGRFHAIVVDPQSYAYDRLRESGGDQSTVRVLDTGRAALQILAGTAIHAWIINVRLPDMSGFELYDILHPRHTAARFVLVGDQYHSDDERRARACGVAAYVCKPPQRWWLDRHQPINPQHVV
ncbi:MAG: response regulator, partial [Planctomycetota bacterium]